MQEPTQSALESLAVFPLPDVVLFPGALLPLRIFEPRYRAMTADVLASSRLMAIARLKPGYEKDYEGRPPIFAIAGVGYVVDSEHLPDGRYNLLLRGVARVRIEAEHAPDRPYRVARARLLTDLAGDPEKTAAEHECLLALCDRVSMAIPDQGAELRALVRAVASPSMCSDVVAAALLRDPDERQLLLETMEPLARLERLASHVANLLMRLTPSSGQPN